MILVFLQKSLHHRMLPKLSQETPAASKLMLGGPRVLPGFFQMPSKYNSKRHRSIQVENENLEILNLEKIIDIGLVEIVETFMACHFLINRMHHEYS